MIRAMKFALFALLALAALAAVVKAEEKFYDENGKEIVVFDSKVGDDEFEDDDMEKRSIGVRGKSAFGLAARHSRHNGFTHGPEEGDELQDGNIRITWYASEDLKLSLIHI